MRAALLGGPFDGRRADLSRTTARIEIKGSLYLRVDDPDNRGVSGGLRLRCGSRK